MYVWPSGDVTGSVHVGALEEFRRALAEGDPLDPRFIPDGLTEADYPRPAKKRGRPRKEETEEAPNGDVDVQP